MTADSTQMQRPVMNPHEKRMQTIQAVLYVIAIILGLLVRWKPIIMKNTYFFVGLDK